MSTVVLVVALAVFATATYLLRALGILMPALGRPLRRWGGPIAVAVLASLVVSSSLAVRQGLALDARAAGLAVALTLALLRAPLLLTLLMAVAVTAVIRHL
ncbi:MAG TPA: AzlD domain-containing protein [Euzebyales bacterium]|nr:AzlD domain-containing protein [Euzebyales bacterium]